MKHEFPYLKDVTDDTLMSIAETRFPEYDSKYNLLGKGLFINKNPLFRVSVVVRHKPKKNKTNLIINRNLTVLGNLLIVGFLPLGIFCTFFLFKKFYYEVDDVFFGELYARAEASGLSVE